MQGGVDVGEDQLAHRRRPVGAENHVRPGQVAFAYSKRVLPTLGARFTYVGAQGVRFPLATRSGGRCVFVASASESVSTMDSEVADLFRVDDLVGEWVGQEVDVLGDPGRVRRV